MSRKCEKIENENCPLTSGKPGNPGICPFVERIVRIETNQKWLKWLIVGSIGVNVLLKLILGG